MKDILTQKQLIVMGRQEIKVPHFVLDSHVAQLVKLRDTDSHKGNYGHALIIAGSHGKIGAAILASKSCLRSGVGLLTSHVPHCGYYPMQTSVPEGMCLSDAHERFVTKLPEIIKYDAIGVGPGLGKEAETTALLKSLLKLAKHPIVLDADAINILSENKDELINLPKNSILTPHIKEFQRLVGAWDTLEERFEKQLQFANRYDCIVVLKDAKTCICSPNGQLFINTTGNAGMATGGSGDVLTGIVTGLAAQGYQPLHAAIIGVYFHGKAGDQAALNKGMSALIASDIIENLRIERD